MEHKIRGFEYFYILKMIIRISYKLSLTHTLSSKVIQYLYMKNRPKFKLFTLNDGSRVIITFTANFEEPNSSLCVTWKQENLLKEFRLHECTVFWKHSFNALLPARFPFTVLCTVTNIVTIQLFSRVISKNGLLNDKQLM